MIIKKAEGLKFHNLCTATLRDAKTREVIQVEKVYNVVTDVGIRLMLDRLGGLEGTIHSKILYGAVGTGSTAATTGDVKLVTEVSREISTYARSGNTATLSVFFNTGDANAVIAEVGFFGGDATDVTDTGILFDRIVFASTITKTSAYTLTCEIDLLITDV